MSRKLFVVAVIGTLVLVALVAPAVAAPLDAQDLTLGQTEAAPRLGGYPTVWPLPIQLSGGSECGGAGGCPL